MKKYILSLSGGLDSSTLLFEYKKRIVKAVGFRYPSVHNERELQSAVLVAEKAGVPFQIIDVSRVFEGMNSGLLTDASAIPDGELSPETRVSCYVPFRNGIFLSILAGIAEAEGVYGVALGTHPCADGGYPDASEKFCKALGRAFRVGTNNGIRLFYPYTKFTKHQVAEKGIKAGLNPDWTYSCFKGGAEPCGTCPACIDRQRALEGLTW